MNEYKVRKKNLEKRVEKDELHEMALVRELKCSKQEVEMLECENEPLGKITERLLYSAVRGAKNSAMYDYRLLKAVEAQYVGLPMSIIQ